MAEKLRIKVKHVEKELVDGKIKPISAELIFPYLSEDYEEEYGDILYNDFKIKLTNEGKVFAKNRHITTKRKKGEYGYDPILLAPKDLKEVEEIYEHWKKISSKLIQSISHGHSFTGHISTTYIFPDGTEKEYKAKAKNFPKSIEGKSIDDKFKSDGCKYVLEYPYEQHYKHGRFDYYLKKTSVSIEDDKTIQVLEGNQIETTLKILKYVDSFKNPEDALSKIIKNE